MNENERTKMDPETAIKVLKTLSDWLFFNVTESSVTREAQHSIDEAIHIAVAALEEKIEL